MMKFEINFDTVADARRSCFVVCVKLQWYWCSDEPAARFSVAIAYWVPDYLSYSALGDAQVD
jgi:hypothetical protein